MKGSNEQNCFLILFCVLQFYNIIHSDNRSKHLPLTIHMCNRACPNGKSVQNQITEHIMYKDVVVFFLKNGLLSVVHNFVCSRHTHIFYACELINTDISSSKISQTLIVYYSSCCIYLLLFCCCSCCCGSGVGDGTAAGVGGVSVFVFFLIIVWLWCCCCCCFIIS